MKKIQLVGTLCVACLFACCNKNVSSETPKVNAVMNINISPQVAQNTSNFAFNFFKALQQTQSDTTTIFVSPLSLHMNLGMLLNGAGGNTYVQLQNALGLNGLSIDEINKAYQTLLQDLPNADSKVQLALANSMWYKNTFSILADYSNTLKNYFRAGAYPSLFEQATVDSINQWASDHTNKKIPHILTSIEDKQRMFLLNALYFKGNWSSQFDKSKTIPQIFTLANGTTKQVQMMSQENNFTYSSNKTYSIIRLPYGNGQFSMTILLPQNGNKIEDVMNNFSANDWNTFQGDSLKSKVDVRLPRFAIPLYDVDLISTLHAMGATDAFNFYLANLSKIDSTAVNGKLYVNLLKQFTYLNVDEVGTEAAAVTITGVAVNSLQPIQLFTCDHPFGIIISENTSNTILFMGRIMNPQSK